MRNSIFILTANKISIIFVRLLLSVILLTAALNVSASGSTQPIVIVGGTIIDTADFGRSANDIENSVVVISGGKIVAAGKKAQIETPQKRVDYRRARKIHRAGFN